MEYKLSYTSTKGNEMTLNHNFLTNTTYVFHEVHHNREKTLVDSLKKDIYDADEMIVIENFVNTTIKLDQNIMVKEFKHPDEFIF